MAASSDLYDMLDQADKAGDAAAAADIMKLIEEQDAPAPAPVAAPAPVEAGPGHAAIIRKMDDAAQGGPEKYRSEFKKAGDSAVAGATRYLTGRVIPAVEDFARGRLGTADRKHTDPTTGKPYSYLSQGITDWGEENYQKNKGGWATAGEAGMELPLSILSGGGIKGGAGYLANILRNTGAAAVPELMLAPNEGDTRLGNAGRVGGGTGAATGTLGALGKIGGMIVDRLRGPSYSAAKKVVSEAGGRPAAEAGVQAVVPNPSGVAGTPASRAGVPGWEDLERASRSTDPGAYVPIDTLMEQTAKASGGASRDALWQSLSKTRVNDLHRGDVKAAIDASGLRPEFKKEMEAILAQYGKGANGNLKNLIDHLIQGSQGELKTPGGKVRLLPEEQEKWAKQLEQVTQRYFDPKAVATQQGAIQGINRDVARSRSLMTDAPPPNTPFLDATGRVLNSPGVGVLASGTGHGKLLAGGRTALVLAKFLRKHQNNPALNDALSKGDASGIRALLDQYDKVSDDKTKAQIVANLLARGAGTAASDKVPYAPR